MKRRFTKNADGQFVDRGGVVLPLASDEIRSADGSVLGRVSSITLDLVPRGGKGEAVALTVEQQPTATAELPELLARTEAELPDPVAVVWKHYVEVMEPRNAALDPETRKLIRDALTVGTVEEWCAAVDGCKASDHHMGRNDRGKRYNKPSHIFKGKRGIRTTREQLDMFLDYLPNSGVQSAVTSADPALLSQAKQAIRDAHEFPGDQTVVARATEAERWLEGHGWLVERDLEGRPTFAPRP